MADKLRYDVEVNTRDGVRELDRLGQAGKEAGQDIEAGLEGVDVTVDTSAAVAAVGEVTEAFDKVPSKADEVAAAVVAMATKIDSETREAAAAADLLRIALGDAAERVDASAAVAELQRVGLTADEIRADVDKLADAFKQVDQIDTSRAVSGLDSVGDSARRTGGDVDTLRNSSDQSRSVLANMAGNTAQDLGALGGAAGSAGVLIGQLAEYATEGNIKMTDLAKVAGPMLGLAAAGLAASKAMEGIAESKAFDKSQVDAYTKALQNVNDETSTVVDALESMESFRIDLDPKPWEIFASQTADATETLAQYGVTVQDVAAYVTGSTDEQLAFLKAIDESTDCVGDYAVIHEFLNQQIDYYNQAVELAGNNAGLFALKSGEITAAMSKNTVELGRADVLWNRIITDLADGRADTEKATDAWNVLRDELDLSNAKMAAMAQTKLDEKLAADADAAEAAATKIVEMRDALAEAQAAALEYQQTVTSTEWGQIPLQAARTVLGQYFADFRRAGDVAADNEAAYDDLAESLEGADEAGLNFFESFTQVDSPEGRAVRESLQGLSDSLIPQIEQAYVDAGGDQDAFYANMHEIGAATLAEMQNELGLTSEQVNFLAQQIGLTPEMVETTFEMIGIEEAKLKLDLLSGYIDDLPKDVETKVTQQILLGDYVGAVATVQNYASGNPATMYVYADVSQALNAIAHLRDVIRGAQMAAAAAQIAVGAQTASAATSTVAAGPSTLITMNLPRGTRPDDAVRAADRYARRNGRAHARR